MIEEIEALMALERTGTVSEAAAQLRLTQSAVSKRIQSLQNQVSFQLLRPEGRKVKLTPDALDFLQRARPLISELKSLKQMTAKKNKDRYSIALSDSIAATWGPKLIREALNKIKNLELDFHVHRSTLVEENIKMGKYDLGLCIPLSGAQASQIHSQTIVQEPMVLIAPGLSSKFENAISFFNDDKNKNFKILTIEKNSGTWKSLEDQFLKFKKNNSIEYIHIESFAAVVSLVKENFGYGLIPLGLAQTMGLSRKQYLELSSQFKREVKLISRKSLLQRSEVKELLSLLSQMSKNIF